jgi:hypothetical protein
LFIYKDKKKVEKKEGNQVKNEKRKVKMAWF